MSATIAKLVREDIRQLKAYHVPSAEGFIKLDAMENPYQWPQTMRERWLARIADAPLNRYPEPSAPQLATQLRAHLGLAEDVPVLFGNGSDELIQIIVQAVAGSGRVVMAPDPGFVMYRMIASFQNLEFVGVPLCPDDFSLDLPAMLAAIETHQPAVIFLAYPNNPTGNLFDRQAMEQIIAAAPGLVVIDEAYTAFAADSWLQDIQRYPDVLLLRTVSKVGLAGLRLGYLLGSEQWLAELDKLRLPYNINVLTQLSTQFALEHASVLEEQAATLRAERQGLMAALAAKGFHVWPSETNFVLIRVVDANAVFEQLLAAKILIKRLHGAHPALDNCLRITVGTAAENAALLAAI